MGEGHQRGEDSTLDADYRQLYGLEHYLFDVVGPLFRQDGRLDAFDFFCIVIWKANRAKSRIAKRLLATGAGDLEEAVERLTEGIAARPEPEEKLRYLLGDWGFQLPMASAILTVLDPNEFTIYDVRVCDSLGAFHILANVSQFDRVWQGYGEFLRRVREMSPSDLSLRDADRYLWGKSFNDQLRADIEREFS
jgi:hypothetical protein